MDKKKFKYLTKKNNKIIYLIISVLLLAAEPLKSNCNSINCSQDNKLSKKEKINFKEIVNKNYYFSKEKIKSHNNNLFGIEPRELNEIYILFSRLLIANDPNINSSKLENSYDIESDKQYLIDDVYYAEGNVIVNLNNGEFKANKISFDKKNRILKAFDKVIFKKGDQYFKADYLEYDFVKFEGFIDNIFGIVDLSNLKKDFNFNKNIFEKYNYCLDKETILVNNPVELDLLSSNNKRSKNQISKKNIKFDFSKINKWKFRSQKIIMEKDKWSADLIDFSNDPFIDSQFIIRSKQFYGEIIGDSTKLTSSSTIAKFDDKFSIPLGRRILKSDEKEDTLLKWGIAYEDDDKDGIYLIRNLKSINLKDTFLINFKPYFLVQRAFLGKSDSFRARDSALTSSNVNKNIFFSDYFALNTKIKGNISNWQLKIDTDLTTLNPNNFYDAFSLELNLLRNLFYRKNTISNFSEDICNNSQKKHFVKKTKVDFGIYKTIDKDDVYRSYGGKIITKHSNHKKDLKKDYSIIFDIGDFKGKSIKNEVDPLNLLRYGSNISLNYDYQIFDFNDQNPFYNQDYRYTSELINKGLFFRTNFNFGIYEYSNDRSQNIFSASLGPTYIIGNLKNYFLDYTEISIIPEFVSKRGESPFSFDDFNNDSRVKILISQQLLGPLILDYESYLNINNASENYGNFSTKKISLQVSRRAYQFALTYDANAKNIFLGFEIFDFSNKNFQKKF